MFKAGFFFHTPVEARFFFHKELKVRLFFYSHVSSQRYSHYFQGWGKIIFFATYQSKKIFSTYRLGQIIFFGQKQRQIIFSKTLPAPPPQIMKWSLPYQWSCNIFGEVVAYTLGKREVWGLRWPASAVSHCYRPYAQHYLVYLWLQLWHEWQQWKMKWVP